MKTIVRTAEKRPTGDVILNDGEAAVMDRTTARALDVVDRNSLGVRSMGGFALSGLLPHRMADLAYR
jgi:hypothetical protein